MSCHVHVDLIIYSDILGLLGPHALRSETFLAFSINDKVLNFKVTDIQALV